MLKYRVPEYNFPKPERCELDEPRYDGMRFYRDVNDTNSLVLPSVTTTIGYGDTAKLAILASWRKYWRDNFAKYGFSPVDIEAYFNLASNRGTVIHEAIENLHEHNVHEPDFDNHPDLDLDYIERLETIMASMTPKDRKRETNLYQHPRYWWEHAHPYLMSLEGEIIAQELQMFYVDDHIDECGHRFGVAGTADLIYIDTNGDGVVADYKTTGYAHATPSRYSNYSWDKPSSQFDAKWLQLTPYAVGFNRLMGQDIIKKLHLISIYPGGVESFIVPLDVAARDLLVGTKTADYYKEYNTLLNRLIYG